MIRHKKRYTRRINAKRLALVITVICAIIFAIVFLFQNDVLGVRAALQAGSKPEPIVEPTYAGGVSVGGIDISGMKYEEAEAVVQKEVDDKLNAVSVEFSIDNDAFAYSAQDMGIYMDYNEALEKAGEYLVVLDGTAEEENFIDADGDGIADDAAVNSLDIDFPLEFSIDNSVLEKTITNDFDDYGAPAIDAKYATETSRDETTLMTSAKIIVEPGENGFTVEKDEIIENVLSQVETQKFEKFEVSPTVIEAGGKELLPELDLLGEYETKFDSESGSREERMYNIWKISDLLNGAIIGPGDTFSVNERVGPRTEELGWQLAPGIESGQFTDQPGGGICQVSTTMYNAALIAEMEMVKRFPHTIPSNYVPRGLDATISTEGPDFVVRNPTDTVMIMIVECDVPNRSVKVKIYGYMPRDYTLSFSTEDAEVIEPGAPVFVINEELPPGTYNVVVEARKGYVANIYKHTYDLHGNEIGEKESFSHSTYNPIPMKIELSPDFSIPPEGTTFEQFKSWQ